METRDEPQVEYVVVPPAEPSWKRRRAPQLIALAIVLVLLVVFVVQNDEPVEVRMTAWDVELRLAWALMIAAAFGVVLGWLLPKIRR